MGFLSQHLEVLTLKFNMIFYNTGRTGTGKTQYSVKLCYKFWKNGTDIATNTPLFFTTFNLGQGGEVITKNPEYFTTSEKISLIIRFILLSKLFKKEIHINRRGRIRYIDTIDDTFHLTHSVIFFDEGQTIFRSYDWETIPRMFLHKLEQNRKDGNDMITTAQRPNAVNINYRYLVQEWQHFELIFRIGRFQWYRQKEKDVDMMDENLKEPDIPNTKIHGLLNFKLLTPFAKVFKLYDSFFNIGYEPLQHYKIKLGGQRVKLHLESGMKIKDFISKISTYNKLFTYDEKD